MGKICTRRHLALFALFWAGCVSADTMATAELSNLSATLFDLDPDDGISPSISFNLASSHNARVGYSVYEFSPINPPRVRQDVVTAQEKLGPVKTSAVGGLWSAAASVSGDGSLAGSVLQVSATSTSMRRVEVHYYVDAVALRDNTNASSAEAFMLSPHTRVVFGADVDLFARVTFDTVPQDVAGFESAFAGSRLLVFEQGVGYSPGAQLNIVEVSAHESSDTFVAGVGSRTRQFTSIQFDNVTSAPLSGAVGFAVDVRGEARYILPVPEPGSAALLALGLLLLGWRFSATVFSVPNG